VKIEFFIRVKHIKWLYNATDMAGMSIVLNKVSV
jgi:hypothetical protein